MQRRLQLSFLPSAIVLLMASSHADAFQGCASYAGGIQIELSDAASNNADDEIRIVAGTYPLTQVLLYSGDDTHALTISGGWNASCTALSGGTTTLDGQSMDQVMRIYSGANSNISVSRITFVNGHIPLSGSGYASGLSIRSGGNVLVERNLFFYNQGPNDYNGGALAVGVQGSGEMQIRNNLIALNSAGNSGAGVLSADNGEQVITGNTVVGNQATVISNIMVGGFFIADSTSAHFTLSNNLLWNNTGGDLYNRNMQGTTLLHNDVGVFTGNPADAASSGNLSIDPVFAGGLINFRLASRSPLVNWGIDNPVGGVGSTDLVGAPRLQGSHVDIGAYESDVLLYSGFETLP